MGDLEAIQGSFHHFRRGLRICGEKHRQNVGQEAGAARLDHFLGVNDLTAGVKPWQRATHESFCHDACLGVNRGVAHHQLAALGIHLGDLQVHAHLEQFFADHLHQLLRVQGGLQAHRHLA